MAAPDDDSMQHSSEQGSDLADSTTPLLGRDPQTSNSGSAGPGPGSEVDAASHTFREEAIRIIRLAGPLALQDVLLLLQSTIIIAFVGRVGAASLSAIILSYTTYNVTGLSLLMGIASGAETLSGQCYGAKNYGAVGVILQRSLLINWLASAMIFLLWTQSHRLLTFAGQDPGLAAEAVKQLWISAPSLIFTGTSECLKRYLMAQGIVVPTCLAYIVGTLLTPLVAWAAIFWFGLGISGASVALNVITLINFATLAGYVVVLAYRQAGGGKETWLGWSWGATQRWGEYLSLAIPSTLMLCLEWWTWEAITLMAGELKHADINLGVMGILFQIGGLTYMPPIGLQGAASTRVANELGDGRPAAARLAFRAAMLVAFFTQAAIAALLYFGRHLLARSLSSDAQVVSRVAGILPIMAIMIPCDGMNAVCSGVVRGCGRQMLAAALNIFTFWGIGLPLAAALAFKAALGVKGLWIGLGVVTYIQLFAITTLVCCLNWKREAKRAQALAESNRADSEADPLGVHRLLEGPQI